MLKNGFLIRELKLNGFDGSCVCDSQGGLYLSDDRNSAYFSLQGSAEGDDILLSKIRAAVDSVHTKQLSAVKKNLPFILFKMNPVNPRWIKAYLRMKML